MNFWCVLMVIKRDKYDLGTVAFPLIFLFAAQWLCAVFTLTTGVTTEKNATTLPEKGKEEEEEKNSLGIRLFFPGALINLSFSLQNVSS